MGTTIDCQMMIVKKSAFEVFVAYFFNKEMEEKDYISEITKIEQKLHLASASYKMKMTNQYCFASCIEKSQEKFECGLFDENEIQNDKLYCKRQSKYLSRRDVLMWTKDEIEKVVNKTKENERKHQHEESNQQVPREGNHQIESPSTLKENPTWRRRKQTWNK